MASPCQERSCLGRARTLRTQRQANDIAKPRVHILQTNTFLLQTLIAKLRNLMTPLDEVSPVAASSLGHNKITMLLNETDKHMHRILKASDSQDAGHNEEELLAPAKPSHRASNDAEKRADTFTGSLSGGEGMRSTAEGGVEREDGDAGNEVQDDQLGTLSWLVNILDGHFDRLEGISAGTTAWVVDGLILSLGQDLDVRPEGQTPAEEDANELEGGVSDSIEKPEGAEELESPGPANSGEAETEVDPAQSPKPELEVKQAASEEEAQQMRLAMAALEEQFSRLEQQARALDSVPSALSGILALARGESSPDELLETEYLVSALSRAIASMCLH
eukprot:2018642-Rhodomonas_salina.1